MTKLDDGPAEDTAGGFHPADGGIKGMGVKDDVHGAAEPQLHGEKRKQLRRLKVES
jgi:hypothetical protein